MKSSFCFSLILSLFMHVTGFSQCWQPRISEYFEFGRPHFEDFDNDGKTDLLMPNYSEKAYTVYRFENGNYIPFSRIPFAEGNPFFYGNSSFVNIDNDGTFDLVDVLTNSFYAYRRADKGLVFDTLQVNVPGLAQEGVWADTDNDGDDELFFPKANKSYFYRFKFNGVNYFVSDSFPASPSTSDFKLGTCDFNSDGVKDIVAYSNSFDPDLRVHIDNGSGFNTITDTIGADLDGVFLSGDMNNDGYEDIINVATALNTRIVMVRNDAGVGFSSFAAPLFYTGSSVAASSAILDFNGDQLQDVVVYDGDSLHVFTGDGSMGFSNAVSAKAKFSNGDQMRIADVNSDGIMDVVLIGSREFEVFFGNSSGQLAQWSGWSGIESVDNWLSVDVDNDGLKDVIDTYTSMVYAKQFSPGKFYLPKSLAHFFPNDGALGFGDFNNDGKLDLVTRNTNQLNVWSDINDFTQAPVLSYSRNFFQIIAVEVLKLNTGPNDDLLVVCMNPQFGVGDTVKTFFGSNSTMLSTGQSFLLYDKKGEYVVSDLTNDGFPDFVMMDSYGYNLSCYKGSSSGYLTPAGSYTLSNGWDVASGNLNSSGNQELIVSDFSSSQNDGQFDIYTVSSTMQLTLSNSIVTPSKQYREIETIDLNNDGNLDIYGGDATSGPDLIYLGNGSLNNFTVDPFFQGPNNLFYEPVYTDSLTGSSIYSFEDFNVVGLMSQLAPRISSNINDNSFPCNSQLVTLSCSHGLNSTCLWSNGSTGRWITVNGDGSYYCQVTDASTGCTYSSDTIILDFVNCDSVWPGDANHDLRVDVLDLFPIAANYGDSGLVRSTVSNSWAAWPSSDWNTSYKFIDEKFIDCNGDGVVDQPDTVAILQNYSLTYSARQSAVQLLSTLQPEFTLEVLKPGVNAGDTVMLGISFGAPNDDILDITGLYFDLQVDQSSITTGSLEFNFRSQNFLGQSGADWWGISHDNGSDMNAAISRLNLSPTDGNGIIGELRFILNQNLTSSFYLNHSFAGTGFVNALGELHPLSNNSDSLNISAVGLDDQYGIEGLSFGSNPLRSGEELKVWFSEGIDELSYQWISINGQQLFGGTRSNVMPGEFRIEAPAQSGIYFLRIVTDTNVFVGKVVVD